jgi:CheY-like chemotaxis protein
MTTILVIDDSSTARKWIAREVRKHLPQAEIVESPSGDAGLVLVKSTTFDLVTVDFNMPGLNGIEFIQQLRAFNPSIPVAMITANTQQTNIDRARALKAELYGKPLTEAVVGELLRKAGLSP